MHNLKSRAARGVFALAAVVTGLAAQAEIVTLAPVADTTILEESGDMSNGAGTHVFAGRNASGQVRRALLRFDLSVFPAGTVVNAATLVLEMDRSNAGPEPVTLRRVLNAWGEGTSSGGSGGGGGAPAEPTDATWLHRFYNATLWSMPGGDFAPSSSGMTMVDGLGTYTWTGAGVAGDAQYWIDVPGANHGWIMLGNEGPGVSAKRFASRDNPEPALRPQLILDVTFPPGSMGACCTPGVGCFVTVPGLCAQRGGTFQGMGTSCSPDPCPPTTGACCLPDGSCQDLTGAACALAGGTYAGDLTSCATSPCAQPLAPFVDALPIPPIAQPTIGVPGGAAHYDISMTEFFAQLHRDLPPTRVWGYAGSVLGPTFEARRGLPVTVTWTNDLRVFETGQLRTSHVLPVDTCLHGPDMNGDVPYTVVHLHGGHVPADSDGHPDDAFPPGVSSSLYNYPNNQRAATMWYHDHALGLTRLNVWMGLAGFYLLRDTDEDALNIPRGEFEVPLALLDRSFNADGSFFYPPMWHEHVFGDHILVNGKVWPYFNVKRGKYRFRVLNASNSRAYTLALPANATFWQIASDGGLLAAPVAKTSLTITPGERADIVIDFAPYAPGTELVLTNSAPSPLPGGGIGPEVPNVMKFIVGADAGDTDPLPTSLVPVPRISENEAAQEREFLLRKIPGQHCGHDVWAINGLMWDDITEYPLLGSTEIWSWVNRSGVTHPMHMHLVSFQVLDRQDFIVQGGQIVPISDRVPPPPEEMGWKDTVQARPFQITRVIARFENYAGRFAYHCHILEHEDHEMMRQFEVCEPAAITNPPDDFEACQGGEAHFGAEFSGSSVQYLWFKDGFPLSDGPTGTGSVVTGSGAYYLAIANVGPADVGQYYCLATNGCSNATSSVASLTISGPCCDPDFNADGNVDQDDIACLAQVVAGDPACSASDPDFNRDGNVDQDDIASLEQVVAGAPCP
ncbi:MAG: multicopper oxidase domain-containing protein [Planctomycetota bacterium]|nr:multicopper oxidase domain-containing protein [Planctomycetota bacterium]